MKRLIFLLLLSAAPCLGQSLFTFPSPLPNATFYVCGVPANGNPCSNQTAIFQDQGLSSQISQPVTIGPDGNYGFWTSAGQITIQVQKPYNLVEVIALGGGSGGGFGCTTSGTAGIPFWNGTNCQIDVSTQDDGAGNMTMQSLTAAQTATGNIVNATTSLSVGGASGTAAALTILGNASTPGNPTANNFLLYGNLSNDGISCLFGASGLPCLITSIATQNGGSALATHVGPFTVNCSTGMSCTDSAGLLTLTATISTVADNTFTTGTTAISANTCTGASTVTMTGVTTTMAFSISPNADVSGVTGWGSTGGLVIDAWPTANTLNWKVCNQTGSSITPGASVTWNVNAR